MISYKPLLKRLIDQDIKKKDLVQETGMAWSTMAKLSSQEYISLEIVDKLCEVLDCQPGDILEYIPGRQPKGRRSGRG